MEINRDQIEEIDKYKWIRSEEEGHDIGKNQAALEWCQKYAKLFRDYWERENATRRSPDFINDLIALRKIGVRNNKGELPENCEYEILGREPGGSWIVKKVG